MEEAEDGCETEDAISRPLIFKDYGGGSMKPHHHSEARKKRLTYIVGVTCLCRAFYVLGGWQLLRLPQRTARSNMMRKWRLPLATRDDQTTSISESSTLDFESHHQLQLKESGGAETERDGHYRGKERQIGVAPGGISSIEFIEGDGGVGSIKKTCFAEGNPLKWVKHRIDVIDTENLVSKYSLIETGVDFDKIEFVNYEVKFEACDGGSIVKNTSEYHTKEGVELKEDDIKGGKDKAFGLYKVIEEYLIANPDVYA